MKIPKYLTSQTQEIARPSQVDIFAQLAEHLGLIRMQCVFLGLTAMSKYFNSSSHWRIIFCNAVTDDVNNRISSAYAIIETLWLALLRLVNSSIYMLNKNGDITDTCRTQILPSVSFLFLNWAKPSQNILDRFSRFFHQMEGICVNVVNLHQFLARDVI